MTKLSDLLRDRAHTDGWRGRVATTSWGRELTHRNHLLEGSASALLRNSGIWRTGLLDSNMLTGVRAVNSIPKATLLSAGLGVLTLKHHRASDNSRSALTNGLSAAGSALGLLNASPRVASPPREVLEFGRANGFVLAQAKWVNTISAGLRSNSLRSFSGIFPASFDFGTLFPQIQDALDSAALEIPGTLEGLEDFLPDIAREVSDGVEHAAYGDAAMGERTIRDFLMEVLDHYGVLGEDGRAKVTVILAIILFSIGGNTLGEIGGSEWDRWRDAPAQIEARVNNEIQSAQTRRVSEELAELVRLVAHPPRPAVVARRAWLRQEPSTKAKKLGIVLDVGTELLVLERADGWVRVELEPVPGDVRDGWVYGRLLRFE